MQQVREWNAGRPPQESELPVDARTYLRIVKENADDPRMKKYFYKVTLCYAQGPSEPVPFYLMEFRDGLNAGLIWTDAQSNWGTGGWYAIPHADAEVPLDISHLRGSFAYETFFDALSALLGMERPSK